MRPTNAALRVVDLLIEEFPALTPLRPRIRQALGGLQHNEAYRSMMFSAATTPVTCTLHGRFPEFSATPGRSVATRTMHPEYHP
jgi:hypothetical protein